MRAVTKKASLSSEASGWAGLEFNHVVSDSMANTVTPQTNWTLRPGAFPVGEHLDVPGRDTLALHREVQSVFWTLPDLTLWVFLGLNPLY